MLITQLRLTDRSIVSTSWRHSDCSDFLAFLFRMAEDIKYVVFRYRARKCLRFKVDSIQSRRWWEIFESQMSQLGKQGAVLWFIQEIQSSLIACSYRLRQLYMNLYLMAALMMLSILVEESRGLEVCYSDLIATLRVFWFWVFLFRIAKKGLRFQSLICR